MADNAGSDGKGDDVKMVPESDLLALKKSLGEKVTKLEASLTTAQSERDSKQDELVAMTASKEEVDKKAAELHTKASEVDDLKSKLEEATKGRDAASTKLLELRRKSIAELSSVSVDDLKDKTSEQLDALEEAIGMLDKKKKSGKYDGGAGGGGGGGKRTGREMIRDGLAEGG